MSDSSFFTEFVVEDGTGLQNATSYASIQEADDYFANRMYRTSWGDASTTDQMKMASLATATESLDSRLKWAGSQLTTRQSLAFPRISFINQESNGSSVESRRRFGSFINDSIQRDNLPKEVKMATIQYAADIIQNNRFVPSQGTLSSIGLGGGVQFAFNTPPESQVIPSYIEEIVSDLLAPSSVQRIVINPY